MIRQQNVSVLVLRSFSEEDRPDKGCTGRLVNLVEQEWGDKTPRPPNRVDSKDLSWQYIKGRLNRRNSESDRTLALHARHWDCGLWADARKLKDWWVRDVDKHTTDTVWSHECSESEYTFMDNLEFHTKIKSKSDSDTITLLEAELQWSYAVLVGGKGSPPHFDTIKSLISDHIEVTTAVGHIIQGVKWFFGVPPFDGHSKTFLDRYLACNESDMTKEQKKLRQHMRSDEKVPMPFQGVHSLGWVNEDEWKAMGDYHFHELIAKDNYVIQCSAIHAAINAPSWTPASIAHDDMWRGGGRGDIRKRFKITEHKEKDE